MEVNQGNTDKMSKALYTLEPELFLKTLAPGLLAL